MQRTRRAALLVGLGVVVVLGTFAVGALTAPSWATVTDGNETTLVGSQSVEGGWNDGGSAFELTGDDVTWQIQPANNVFEVSRLDDGAIAYAFEDGGFVVDGGHPTERFTAEPPAEGDWDVPPVLARHDVPAHWRFVVVVPDTEPGQSGSEEDQSMRQAVERADPGIADEISTLLTRRLLPAIATRDRRDFGQAAARLGRLNGAWYADEQGGVYRPPAGSIVDALSRAPTVSGAGQSSWGPTVWGLTTDEHAPEAREAGVLALDEAGVEGSVRVVAPRNVGASLSE